MSILVGRKAPDFTTQAVLSSGEIVEDFQLSSVISGKYGVVFFYPLDFTFVCASLAVRSSASRSTRTTPTSRGAIPPSKTAGSAS